ncbi:phage terminase large subunit family protein [Comamonas jiangduensis]|uniref:Phage terminase large subunit family protein n=1 Tax=Comamonas jiangduensis TaxID=1194168 RepID=A0ABV4IEM5_9BURK
MNAPLSKETIKAIKEAVALGLESLRADEPQSLSQWAAEHFKLAGESSHQKGGWVAWPFQIGVLDFMSDDRIKDLAVKKSKRVGYSKMITAFICYNIAHRRRKQALWQPTDDDRDSFVKSEIEPLLDPVNGVPAVLAARKRDSRVEETIKYKPFRDSVLHLLGGKAARAYRRITVAVAILDEWTAFDQTVGGTKEKNAGSPGSLAKGRLEGAAFPKFVGGSTPGIKGLCHVSRACEDADDEVDYLIECPHCREEHPLRWGGKEVRHGFKWERGKPETVRHVCPHCLESITQADYMPGGWPLVGAWVCRRSEKRYGADQVWRDGSGNPCQPPASLGVHIWAAYSPQRAWSDIVDEFEKALRALEEGDAGPMTTFTNETLGEAWELKGESTDEHVLQARAEDYPLEVVPKGGLVLTAGVDVQRTWWQINVWAWGRGLESWIVDRIIIQGNPASESDWAPVTEHLQRRYRQAWHGGSLGISAISIDSSDQTQAVYNYVRNHQHLLPNLRAIKGDTNDNRPILGPSNMKDVDHKGVKLKNGIKLWLVGVDNAKDLLLGQLALAGPGPGYLHFSKHLPREYFEQLTAEQRVLAKVQGKDAYKWVKRRQRNEDLDCRNYALHAAMAQGLHKYTDARWQQVEQLVQPPVDLFSLPAQEGQPASTLALAPDVDVVTSTPLPRKSGLRRNAGFGRSW